MCSHIQLCFVHLESSFFQHRHPKATVWWAMQHAHKKIQCAWGLGAGHSAVPLYVYNPLFSVQMPEIPGESVLYSLCYNISIWGEDECVPFFISPLPASFAPTSHQLKAAVWVVKSYAQSQDTLWEGCHLRVFFACLMNHVHIPNSSSKEPAPVSYYTQGYTEWDFSLNDRAS